MSGRERWPAGRRYFGFCRGLRELQHRFGFSVTSWWRTPRRNAEQPGADAASQHQEGTAVDVVFDPGAGPVPGAFKAAAREHGLEALDRGKYWHLEWFTQEP